MNQQTEDQRFEADIERIREIPNVRVSDDLTIVGDLSTKKVVLTKETLRKYHEAINPSSDKGFLHRIRNFLSAENDAGRKAKIIKDFILIFTPFRKRIESVTEWISDVIQPQQKEDVMKKKVQVSDEKKTYKSSQFVTFGIVFVAALLMKLGWVPADVIPLDPQAEWVALIASALGMIFRVITSQPVKAGRTIRQFLNRQYK